MIFRKKLCFGFLFINLTFNKPLLIASNGVAKSTVHIVNKPLLIASNGVAKSTVHTVWERNNRNIRKMQEQQELINDASTRYKKDLETYVTVQEKQNEGLQRSLDFAEKNLEEVQKMKFEEGNDNEILANLRRKIILRDAGKGSKGNLPKKISVSDTFISETLAELDAQQAKMKQKELRERLIKKHNGLLEEIRNAQNGKNLIDKNTLEQKQRDANILDEKIKLMAPARKGAPIDRQTERARLQENDLLRRDNSRIIKQDLNEKVKQNKEFVSNETTMMQIRNDVSAKAKEQEELLQNKLREKGRLVQQALDTYTKSFADLGSFKLEVPNIKLSPLKPEEVELLKNIKWTDNLDYLKILLPDIDTHVAMYASK